MSAQASPKDQAQALAAIHARVSQTPWSAESYAQQIAQSETILVAQDSAFALGRVAVGEAELLQIATDPDFQRRGLGRAVLCKFEQAAAARGAFRAFLEVAQSNGFAISLYSSAGWSNVGLRKGYYRRSDGTREDAVIMAKNL